MRAPMLIFSVEDRPIADLGLTFKMLRTQPAFRSFAASANSGLR